MSVTPLACSVAPAVIMIASAMKFENPIPTKVSRSNPVNRSLALMRRPLEYLPGWDRPDVLGFL